MGFGSIGHEGVAFESYTDNLRLNRKLLNTALNPSTVVDYSQIQEIETYSLMARLLDSPRELHRQIRRSDDL